MLMRITAVGMCGFDVLWYSHAANGDASLDVPLVLALATAGLTSKGRWVGIDPAGCLPGPLDALFHFLIRLMMRWASCSNRSVLPCTQQI